LRKNEYGALLSFDDGSPADKMEFMKPEHRRNLYGGYSKYIVKKNNDFIYLGPKLKGIVTYRNLTKKGYVRIPSFKHRTAKTLFSKLRRLEGYL
jgi:DNA ligase-1